MDQGQHAPEPLSPGLEAELIEIAASHHELVGDLFNSDQDLSIDDR